MAPVQGPGPVISNNNCTARVQHFALIYNMNLIKIQQRACMGFFFSFFVDSLQLYRC